MLLQFTVENFKSFADRQVLSWMAAPDERHPEGQVFEIEGLGRVLRSLVLYGANASGKSNVVRALQVARELVFEGVRPGAKLPVSPHRLDPARLRAPTRFEFELWLDGVHYAYGLVVTTERVMEEWLHRVDGEVDHTVFVRRDAGDRPQVEFGDGLQVEGARRAFYDFVAEGTRPEQPLLAELRARNAIELRSVFDAFGDIQVSASDDRFQQRLDANEELRPEEVRDRMDDASRSAGRTTFLHPGREGQVRVIDELERSMHTQLTRFLVDRLNRSERRVQFLFTTHDTHLLDANVFGRDAIWFVEKNTFGASRLYSLAEFKREHLDELTGRIECGYLQGRFGAVPFVGGPTQLGWGPR